MTFADDQDVVSSGHETNQDENPSINLSEQILSEQDHADEGSQVDIELKDASVQVKPMKLNKHEQGSQENIPGKCYLVYESALLMLFSICSFCGHKTCCLEKLIVGSFECITQSCSDCHKERIWDSRPFIGSIPAGNVITSSAILFSGALPAQALRVFDILSCYMISSDTFYRHQRTILQTSINTVWERKQKLLFDQLKGKPLELGDGRADSPGHSAKYGCYSLMDLSTNKIAVIKLVQSNEVGGSYYMEKEGLSRAI
uniref:Uncharacterized protein n=1 Tax=Amphimedon queenslandica TaxID=400682 RepID=A0A1X7TAL7_AMPQE